MTRPGITARGTYDEERAVLVRHRCGRLVTGTHPCDSGGPCPFEPPERPVGRFGARWAQPEREEGGHE